MNLFLRHMTVGIALGISSFGTTVFSSENSTPNLKSDTDTAKNIIIQMADTYKDCKSYLDSGVVKTTFFMKKGPYVDNKPFTTAFVRPGRFRFAFRSQLPMPKAKPTHCIIWVKNKEILVWKDAKSGIQKETSLSDAIADFAGTSGGASQTIPVLIKASKVGGRSVSEIQQPKRLKDSLQDGVICYLIQGKRMASSTSFITLWISKKTFLIHRIDSSQKFTDFRTETTKIYKPQINIAIDESKLAFNAPGQTSKPTK